jgi:hypothetical protein
MAMQARTLTRTLLVSAASPSRRRQWPRPPTRIASTSATSKQSTTKSSAAKPAATKRLDFAPSSSIKETATRPAAPGANAQTPAKEGWHCDHSGASDA